MKSLLVHNKTKQAVTIMLEPIGTSYKILPGSKVSVVGTFSSKKREYGEIALRPGHIAIWTSMDAEVYQNGVVMPHIEDE